MSPLSDLISCGNPNLWTQSIVNAVLQLSAVASDIGMASTHLLVLSIMVSGYFIVLEARSGPTTSICMLDSLWYGRGGLETLGQMVLYDLNS